ncbi:enterochelin esterase [Streptomyces sp. NPDC058257]|uniref:enterochelin esterase n=1 Tax=Streptomyces sp. NPDC058257 TaxID=3346409 RepID=UPI0036EFB98D
MFAADAVPRRPTGVAPCIERVATRLADASEAERAALLEEFWADAAHRGTPLIEAIDGDPDHCAVTFLWRGHRATRQVLLLAEGVADHADLAASLLSPLPGTDIWHLGYRLRADHRASYRMAADISPGAPPASAALLQRRLLSLSAHAAPDPLNSSRMRGRWPDRDTSVFELPRAPARLRGEPADGMSGVSGVSRGRVERHRLPAGVLGAERDVWAYLPPGGEATPELPVLVLCDGDMWFGRLAFQDTLDALIADGALPPLAVLAPDAVDRDTRRRELDAYDSHVSFLADELLPWAAGRWPLTTDPARTLVAGQGLGGLASLYAGFLRPERFGNVLSQSAPVSRLSGGVSRPIAVCLDVGLREGEILDHHRDLYEVLRSRGCPVTLRVYNGGHDWACWRRCLTEGLVGLLGH